MPNEGTREPNGYPDYCLGVARLCRPSDGVRVLNTCLVDASFTGGVETIRQVHDGR
jgi:hypothetical protein